MLHDVALPNTKRVRLLATVALASACAIACDAARAQAAPDTENGRYALSQAGNDFVRLDTRTGLVSTCTNKGGWVCRIVPDERAALDSEIGKLQSDNKKLKEQLAQIGTVPGKTDTPLAKEDSKKSAQDSTSSNYKIELQLPADHEKLMAMLDKAWDRLVDMVVRLQKKLNAKV